MFVLSRLPLSLFSFFFGLDVTMFERVNRHIWQFQLLIKERERIAQSIQCCRSEVLNGGDIINYQLRIFPSKQIKQSRELTEQNSKRLMAKIVNKNRDNRVTFERSGVKKIHWNLQKWNFYHLGNKSTKNNKFTCLRLLLMRASLWILFMILFFSRQKLKFPKIYSARLQMCVFMVLRKYFDKRWNSLIILCNAHKRLSQKSICLPKTQSYGLKLLVKEWKKTSAKGKERQQQIKHNIMWTKEITNMR